MNSQHLLSDFSLQPAAFPAQTSVLNSWKEIAGYLGRGVRTVQRWEHDSALPVHRPKGKDRSAVLALREELDDWLRRTSVRSNGNGNGDAGHATSDIAPVLLELARELLTHGNRLASLDRQNRPEMKKLVSAVDEIVRELTVIVSGASVPAGSSGSKPDNQPHLVARKSG